MLVLKKSVCHFFTSNSAERAWLGQAQPLLYLSVRFAVYSSGWACPSHAKNDVSPLEGSDRSMKLGLYWSYATRSLVRGGQRTILAIFCVAVGVMAIVGLQLVGLSVNQALLGNIVDANGGDIRLNADVAPLRQRDLAVFDQLKQ